MGPDSCTQPLPIMESGEQFPGTPSESWNASSSSRTWTWRWFEGALRLKHSGFHSGLSQAVFFPIPGLLWLYHFSLLSQVDSSERHRVWAGIKSDRGQYTIWWGVIVGRNFTCKKKKKKIDRWHRGFFQLHPHIWLIAQVVHTMSWCSGESTLTCNEYLDCKLGPYWQTPHLSTSIPEDKWEWNELMLGGMWPPDSPSLLLSSMFLLGLRIPSRSQRPSH